MTYSYFDNILVDESEETVEGIVNQLKKFRLAARNKRKRCCSGTQDCKGYDEQACLSPRKLNSGPEQIDITHYREGNTSQ